MSLFKLTFLESQPNIRKISLSLVTDCLMTTILDVSIHRYCRAMCIAVRASQRKTLKLT